MNISPIQNYNFNTSPIKKYNNDQVNFGNGYKKPLSEKALKLLNEKINPKLIKNFPLDKANTYLNDMINQVKKLYPNGEIVPFKVIDDNLDKLLEGKVSINESCSLPYYEGIGIAIGEKGIIIDQWKKVHYAVVCLVSRSNPQEYDYKVFARKLTRGIEI